MYKCIIKLQKYIRDIMRLRRKKNLDSRLVAVDCALLAIEGDNFYFKSEEEKFNKIDYKKVFGNDNPVDLELGCGKGGFAIQMAKKYPNRNFIAVEKSSNVIVMACESAVAEKLTNLKFLNVSVENLPYYLSENSIEKIYLNFSCPFPKKTYANRRLTHHKFLRMYKTFMINNGEIIQKTDGKGLFEFSLEQFSQENFLLTDISLDLHSSDCVDNVMTEYESYFVERNEPIYRVRAVRR